ncbi:MAG: hypothetical protein KKB70_01465 [Proteobacteria bacterium]|nr:hypothetical protein [Pseudomonadota bacterium]MBU1611061.1 hypothetical protein [Pseudomonadota bacterium]
MSEHDPSYVANVNELLYDLALKACRKQVLIFTGELKKKMRSLGVSKAKTTEIISEAFVGYKTMDTFKHECSKVMYDVLEAYLRPNQRQKDILGRLLVEYGIVKAYRKQVLYCDHSKQDEAGREKFMKGVIVRPLMRYFLITVRGTLDQIDEFQAKPVLFGLENQAMVERNQDIESIVKEFTVNYKYNKTSTDWHMVYEDIRCKQIAFETLHDILDSVQSMGPDRYLKIINNIQSNNKTPQERTRMKRLFELNDIKQLVGALTRGYKVLETELGPLKR